MSWIYELAVALRNRLFDWGVLRSRSFDVPVISVGNITVGGTGKTPHVEHLIRLLQKSIHVAVLSRGYKRKTKGYLLADADSTQQDIGDEPLQMHRKFPDTYVAVCANRCEGIDRLTTDEGTKNTGVIVLDDAFQHRYVKPGLSILLVDSHRLISHDALLPAGRLRESASGKKRAQIVIVTKCSPELSPLDRRVLTKAINPYPYQSLYFTTMRYGALKGVFTEKEKPLEDIRNQHLLLVTGIAQPQRMEQDLQQYGSHITVLSFPDHHEFTSQDRQAIEDAYAQLPQPRIIVTTEKDATRLEQVEDLSEEVRRVMFKLPITVCFLDGQEKSFNEKILSYVRKNSANGGLVEVEDDDKPQDSNNSGLRPRTISFRNL